MCTDGNNNISFAIFLYDHPGRVRHNGYPWIYRQLLPEGFYAGDMDRKLVISELQSKNIFRIDGEQEDIIL